jgi:uncharacterized membrane protein YsdA (DUF1294 family)
MPWILIGIWYSAMSALAFLVYGHDKRRARRGGWRIPEHRLHLIELLGGWPGAMLARHLLRHKTMKTRFLLVSWAIVAMHLAAWLIWLWINAAA